MSMVVLIVLAVVLVQAAVWIPLLLVARAKKATFIAVLDAELAASGERIVAGPESAVYRGGSRPYSSVKGNGTIVLTDRRLIFRKLTGGRVDVPRSVIAEVRRSKGFRGSRVGGQTHLVVATTDPAELGFFVHDLDAWERALA
jgi:hypothetical protein